MRPGVHRMPSTVRGLVVLVATVMLVAACGGMHVLEDRNPDYAAHTPIHTVFLVAPEDLFADQSTNLVQALGGELAKHGYTVVSTLQIASFLPGHDTSVPGVLSPDSLHALVDHQVDAVLVLRTGAALMGASEIRHAKVAATSTRTQKAIGDIQWDNAWGGMPGSPADHMMRRGPETVAHEIADALARLLG
ncbi:MAG TPA: hypothetical protein VFN42_15125 [Acetobacteraceae bacterium]|nr:hypothetical protein [Acetobacteraceae bacterium]